MTTEDIKEAIEHRDVLLDVQAILATTSGKNFIKYLFKNLEVTELPLLGMSGDILMDKLGFLRAGNSIFKLVAEASPDIAGALLSTIERERNVKIHQEHENEPSE